MENSDMVKKKGDGIELITAAAVCLFISICSIFALHDTFGIPFFSIIPLLLIKHCMKKYNKNTMLMKIIRVLSTILLVVHIFVLIIFVVMFIGAVASGNIFG